jgi:hypothetical protein
MPMTRTVGSYVMGPNNDPSIRVSWENFIVTTNPDGSHTAQTMSRFPGNSMIRHVTQTVGRDFSPLDGNTRFHLDGEHQGTLSRRVVGDTVTSLVMWPDDRPIDQTTFPVGGDDLVLGFHPTTVEGWKFIKADRSNRELQTVRILSSSPTWNGGVMGHGKEVHFKVQYLGPEEITVPAGTFTGHHYFWHTGAIDGDIELWTIGQDEICARVISHSKGVTSELETCEITEFGDTLEFAYPG